MYDVSFKHLRFDLSHVHVAWVNTVIATVFSSLCSFEEGLLIFVHHCVELLASYLVVACFGSLKA